MQLIPGQTPLRPEQVRQSIATQLNRQVELVRRLHPRAQRFLSRGPPAIKWTCAVGMPRGSAIPQALGVQASGGRVA